MQSADDFASLKCTKRGEVGFAMRAIPLESKFANLNFFTWYRLYSQSTLRLGFGTVDALNGEAFEEVVEIFIKRTCPPSSEAT